MIFCTGSLINGQETGNNHYVATWGKDSNPGTFEQPWATWQKAFSEARPGDTVFFRGGVYYSKRTNVINPHDYPVGVGVSGTRENPIVYMSYPGEWAVLDCYMHCDSTPRQSWDIYNSGISLSYVEHIIFKDFEIRNVFQCDSVLTGAISATYSRNLTFEHIIMHNIGQRGYWIMGGAWKSFYDDGRTSTVPYWPDEIDTTRWINCDVYNLFDTLSVSPGNGADAWKTIHYRGNFLSLEGCRAWFYSDDAFDPTVGNGAEIRAMNCWAMATDKYFNPEASWMTERNGFKIAGPDPGHEEIVSIVFSNCISIFTSNGFYELGYSSNSRYFNNTSVFNGVGFSSTSKGNGLYKNNIVFGSTSLDPGLKRPYECVLPGNYTESHNTWIKKDGYPWFEMSTALPVSNLDFATVDSLQIVALFTAPRKPDGSLPDLKPFMLASNSGLIDVGTDVGLSYNGAAPDIGAFEYDKVPGTNNYYPSVKIISPSNGSVVTKPTNIIINVSTIDPDGYVSTIELYYNDTIKIKELTSPPWSFSWENPMVGNYSLRAVATDELGAKSTSARKWVTVLPGSQTIENSGFLYPNPNNGTFTLLLTEPLKFRTEVIITSLDGRTVYSETMLQEEISKQFNLSFLNPGMYIVTLFNNRIMGTNRFIKY